MLQVSGLSGNGFIERIVRLNLFMSIASNFKEVKEIERQWKLLPVKVRVGFLPRFFWLSFKFAFPFCIIGGVAVSAVILLMFKHPNVLLMVKIVMFGLAIAIVIAHLKFGLPMLIKEMKKYISLQIPNQNSAK